ncbi:hypothetical protein AV530_016723 [Patagioenas fasciata monilis]|uniref:Mos1 transposase HTH domain-containing protein n=1 Tax=Patagioenas fasciata monilis TaxID=372326 RepID=A0A1V4J3C5_PATFA|nr:hypothetical protein AV530_016723 [Patagioenas fasciata monilis]
MEKIGKKQIRAIFLFEFQMCHTAAETTHNINSSFDPGTANERTVQWWFKKFHKGNKRLEDEEHSDWPSKVDSDQLRAVIEADPLTTTQDGSEELSVNYSTVIWHLKQIGKVKKLNKCVPQDLTKNFLKNHRFEVSPSFIMHNNNKLFLSWIVTSDNMQISYDNQR